MPRRPVWLILLTETGLLLLATLATWLHDPLMGRSVLAGGLIFLLPNAWFAWRAFRRQGARVAVDVAQGFFRAEAGKFLLTGAGFAAAFAQFGSAQAAVLLIAYIVLHVANSVLMALFGGV
jgi:ATP synthase protein I